LIAHITNVAAEDVIQVKVNSSGRVEYIKNGIVLATSTSSPTAGVPLYVDVAFSRANSYLEDLKWV